MKLSWGWVWVPVGVILVFGASTVVWFFLLYVAYLIGGEQRWLSSDARSNTMTH